METNRIEFQRKRDFGEILNATFAFFRQNFKSFATSILVVAGPFFLLYGILYGLMMTSYFDFFGGMMKDMTSGSFGSSYPSTMFPGDFMLYYLLLLVNQVIYYAAVAGGTYGYINLYIKKGSGEITPSEVWNEFRKRFWKLLGSTFIVGLLSLIGAYCCCIPGIYLFTSLSLIFMLVVYEDKDFGNAFSRSFNLTHKQWWNTLLLLIVIFLIITFTMAIFSLPVIIIALSNIKGFVNDLFYGESGIPWVWIAIFGIIYGLISLILYTLPFITMAFQYFNIVETHESQSMMNKIEQISPDDQNPADSSGN